MLAIGGAGFISATANVEPTKVAELYNAWVAGDVARAQDLHFELMPLNDVLFKDTNPSPVKVALGYDGENHAETSFTIRITFSRNTTRSS